MSKYIDKVFGEIIHDIYFIKDYEITIFDQNHKVKLIVQASTLERITEFHRDTFIEFEKHRFEIIKKLELKAIQYCGEKYGVSSDKNILSKLSLSSILINYNCDNENRIIGFVINDEYDPEMGIGIEMINEEVHAIGTQHLVC